MGTQRTSNKDIADKLDTLIELMVAQAERETAKQTPRTYFDNAPAPALTESVIESPPVVLDEAYLAHMSLKAGEHATAKGSEVVLYARKNRRGENKLAYAMRDRYDESIVRQPSHLGPVGSFQP